MDEVNNNIDAEKVNIDSQNMSKDAKRSLAYFWDYYKWYVIVPLVVVAVIISIIVTLVQENSKKYLSVAMVNVTKECDDLFKSYEDLVGESISLNYEYRHPKGSDNFYSYDDEINASIQKLQAHIITGRVDVIVTNSRAINEYCENSAFMDLRSVLDEDYIDNLQDYLYYYNDIPVGIDVSGSVILNDAYLNSEENHYLVVSNYSKNVDAAKDFIIYLYPLS